MNECFQLKLHQLYVASNVLTIILTKKNVASLIIKMVPTILILNKKYKIKSNEEVKLVPRIARDVDFTDWPLVFMCSNTAHSIWSTLDPWNRDIIYLLLCKPVLLMSLIIKVPILGFIGLL